VSWSAPQGLPLSTWADQGRRLGCAGRSAGWWIGDWIRFGNAHYGERYARAARITGYDTQTLMTMAYVAGRFEIFRRRKSLSWSHHAEVASLPPGEQDAWLRRAERDRLSVRGLREELRTARRRAEAEEGEGCGADHPHEVVCPECGHRFAAPESHAAEPVEVRAQLPLPASRNALAA
jgi:hypothetical protein